VTSLAAGMAHRFELAPMGAASYRSRETGVVGVERLMKIFSLFKFGGQSHQDLPFPQLSKGIVVSLVLHLSLALAFLVRFESQNPTAVKGNELSMVSFEVHQSGPQQKTFAKEIAPTQKQDIPNETSPQSPSAQASDSIANSSSEPSGPPKAARSGGGAGENQSYLAELRGWLETQKVYPKAARRLGITGEAAVSFKISKNGEFTNIELAKSSTSDLLDESALALIKRSARFRPLPAEIQESAITVTLPVTYTIN
jgi:TonB family protein